jgi:soluble lytic murein transglycosylase-like protein
MVTRFRPGAAAAFGLLLAANSVYAQSARQPSRFERALERAEQVLGAARSAGLLELPEPDEGSYLDVIGALDIDAVAPLPDAVRAWRDFDWEAAVPGTRQQPARGGREPNFAYRSGPAVTQFVTYFTRGAGRSAFENGYRRSGLYRALAERIFREEGVPTDLVWLAQVESLWKPWAVSSASAKGLWQFIPSTGARYGLERTYWIDERADPIDATRAAARYLRFLHGRFKANWLLALAAYNAGEGAVGRAVARAGRSDFWYLYRNGYLPRETRNYVPAILATIKIATDPGRYGIRATPAGAWRYDTVRVRDQVNLRDVADLCDASLTNVWQHNPDLRRGVTPPGRYELRLPYGSRGRFLAAASR